MALLQAKLAAQPIYNAPGDWFSLADETLQRIGELFGKWNQGVDANALMFHFDQLLFEGHYYSHMIGQDQAYRQPNVALAKLVGREMADEEIYFLRGFVNDIVSGRYTVGGVIQEARLMNRAGLYVGKMRGTASKGFVDASPRGAEFVWTLGGSEDKCAECPELAALSREVPFTANTLFQHPGDGSTPCLGNCKCTLVRVSDGAQSQKPKETQ